MIYVGIIQQYSVQNIIQGAAAATTAAHTKKTSQFATLSDRSVFGKPMMMRAARICIILYKSCDGSFTMLHTYILLLLLYVYIGGRRDFFFFFLVGRPVYALRL